MWTFGDRAGHPWFMARSFNDPGSTMLQIANDSEARRLRPEPDGFSVRVYDSVQALPDFWPRSGRPTDACCHVFQTVEFLDVWCEVFAPARSARVAFVEVRDGEGALAMLAPFAITREGGVRILTFVDAGVSDYNAPILYRMAWSWSPRTAQRAWRAIKAALPPFDIALFDKMPFEVQGEINPFHLLADGPNPESCHLTDLRKPWPEIEKRQTLYKRRIKRLAELQKTAPTGMCIASNKQERDAILAALIEQKQRRFEETRVPGFDAHPEKRAFYERATEVLAATGALHLSALMVGEQIISTQWSLVHGKHYYALMSSFELKDWSRYSPSNTLFVLVLKHLFDAGYDWLDMGVGDEKYKDDHCDVVAPLSHKTEPQNWRGWLLFHRMNVMAWLRGSAIWRRLRPLKWLVLRRLGGARLGA